MVRRSALVTVCSDVDRRQLGETANVVVVPNGYERVEVPTEVHDRLPGVPRPRLVIQGSYDYGPNIAAATDFARDILPLVREQIPSATLVLAGKHSDELAAFAGRKDVVATGFVEDMPAMVRSCDVVVVPIRGGSGTRIKILEAWANQIPVVSTELGAEGLGAEHGDELLIAETPEAFAEACVAVLKDREVRGGLVQSATRLFEDRYVWDEIVNDFVSLFRARLDLG